MLQDNDSAPVILITGATDGLGRALALALARRGATLLLHGRSDERGAAVLDEIRTATGSPSLLWYRADFASFEEVRRMGAQVLAAHPRIDVLINNAGLGVEQQRRVSADGYEMVFQVNYLSPFLLTRILLPKLRASVPARIVNVASAGQAPIDFDDVMLERSWSGAQSYCQAKLADIMMTFDLAEDLAGTGVTVNALHPASLMPTKIVTGLFNVKSEVGDGVTNTLRLAVDPSMAGVTGKYFDHDREARANPQAYDRAARERLRSLAMNLTNDARA